MKKVLSKNLLIIVGPLVAANVPDNRPPFHPSSRRPVAIQQQVQLPWWSSLFLTLSLMHARARTPSLSFSLTLWSYLIESSHRMDNNDDQNRSQDFPHVDRTNGRKVLLWATEPWDRSEKNGR